jgi:hypothetical protein
MAKKTKKKARRRKPRVEVKIEIPQPEPQTTDEAMDAGAPVYITEEVHEQAMRNSLNEGIEIGRRQGRNDMLDALCARMAFYEASAMKPVTMTLAWNEALAVLKVLQDAGHGFQEQRALATQKQWRIHPAGNGNMLAVRE